MIMTQLRARVGILLVSGSAAIFAALRIQAVESRVSQVELAPRADPNEVEHLASALRGAEEKITSSLREIQDLERKSEHTAELDRRIDELRGGLEKAAAALADQHKRMAVWDSLEDQIGPRALDARMAEYREHVEEQWRRVDEDARTARQLAESARSDLGQLEKDLARDEERMWRDLVAPSVQIMGEDSVGSGVLLRSEPLEGSKDFRTYAITAWHVIRDLQTAPEDLSFTVPVTIYGEDHHASPETATVIKYDPGVDIAILRLHTKRQIDCGAKLAPRSRLDRVRIFDRIYAVGCPLGNEPIPTFGEIADTHHVVDGSSYWMISAPTYIGNSGGGIFDAQTHELLGIFDKIYTHGTLRPTVIPHMGLVTSLTTIYDWLDKVGLSQLEAHEDVAQAQTASAAKH
jgi:S1-C subfamily serine protease